MACFTNWWVQCHPQPVVGPCTSAELCPPAIAVVGSLMSARVSQNNFIFSVTVFYQSYSSGVKSEGHKTPMCAVVCTCRCRSPPASPCLSPPPWLSPASPAAAFPVRGYYRLATQKYLIFTLKMGGRIAIGVWRWKGFLFWSCCQKNVGQGTFFIKVRRKLKAMIENNVNLTWKTSSCDCWNVYFSIQTRSFCCRLYLNLLQESKVQAVHTNQNYLCQLPLRTENFSTETNKKKVFIFLFLTQTMASL